MNGLDKDVNLMKKEMFEVFRKHLNSNNKDKIDESEINLFLESINFDELSSEKEDIAEILVKFDHSMEDSLNYLNQKNEGFVTQIEDNLKIVNDNKNIEDLIKDNKLLLKIKFKELKDAKNLLLKKQNEKELEIANFNQISQLLNKAEQERENEIQQILDLIIEEINIYKNLISSTLDEIEKNHYQEIERLLLVMKSDVETRIKDEDNGNNIDSLKYKYPINFNFINVNLDKSICISKNEAEEYSNKLHEEINLKITDKKNKIKNEEEILNYQSQVKELNKKTNERDLKEKELESIKESHNIKNWELEQKGLALKKSEIIYNQNQIKQIMTLVTIITALFSYLIFFNNN